MAEKRTGKKKGGARKRAKHNQTSGDAKSAIATLAAPTPTEKPTGFERMLDVMRHKPNHEFTASQIGAELGYRSNLASMMLGKLVSTGKVEKNEAGGTYRLARPKLAAAGD
jgi:hypothetical protein